MLTTETDPPLRPAHAPSRHRRLSDMAGGRENHFNLLRMLAASGVLISHAYPIALGRGTAEPFEHALHGITLGTVCVYVFFAISGFFIALSFERSPTFERFVRARVLRLFPALFVVLALTVFVAGVWLTTVPSTVYWTAALDYVVRNLTLFFLRWELPGVFEDNPYGLPINGSLWTLNYEVLCYFGVTLIGLTGVLRRRLLATLVLLSCIVGYFYLQTAGISPRLRNLGDLGLPFALGVAAFVWRDRIVLDARIALALVGMAALARITPGAELLFRPIFVLALSYLVFWLGHLPIPSLLTYNRLGDYSYGIYIYAFPAQQLVASWGFVDPLANMGAATLIVLPCAALSWHLVEKPALSLK